MVPSLPLLSYELSVSVKENSDRKKNMCYHGKKTDSMCYHGKNTDSMCYHDKKHRLYVLSLKKRQTACVIMEKDS